MDRSRLRVLYDHDRVFARARGAINLALRGDSTSVVILDAVIDMAEHAKGVAVVPAVRSLQLATGCGKTQITRALDLAETHHLIRWYFYRDDYAKVYEVPDHDGAPTRRRLEDKWADCWLPRHLGRHALRVHDAIRRGIDDRPGIKRDTGIAHSSVHDAVHRLEQAGLIQITGQRLTATALQPQSVIGGNPEHHARAHAILSERRRYRPVPLDLPGVMSTSADW